MARLSLQQRELYKFLQNGKPSALATFFSEHPDASVAFLNLRNTRQLRDFNKLLKSDSGSDLDYAFKRIDQALAKRGKFLDQFLEETKPAQQPRRKPAKAPPKEGSAGTEFIKNGTLAVFSAGNILRNLAPWHFKPYEAFRHSVRCLTESIVTTLSAAGLNKTQRHIVELGAGIPAFAVLSTKAAGTLTGIVISFASVTGDAEAALPKAPAPDATHHHLSIEASHIAPLRITVTPARQDTALHALTTNFMEARLGEIPHLSFTENGDIQYQSWHVSHNVASTTLDSAEIVGIPAPLLFAMIGPESSFIADNFNETTEACGLGQFIPSTLYEKVFNYGALIGYPHIQQLVERYVNGRDAQNRPYYGFRPKSEQAAEQIRDACMDPAFNTRLNSVYIARNVGTMQNALKQFAQNGDDYYPVSYTDAYLAHFSGMNRAIRMITDMHVNNGQTPAHIFFTRMATDANLNYLFIHGDRSKPRTVHDFMEFLKTDKGLGTGIMPDMRNWNGHKNAIAANIQEVLTRMASLPGLGANVN